MKKRLIYAALFSTALLGTAAMAEKPADPPPPPPAEEEDATTGEKLDKSIEQMEEAARGMADAASDHAEELMEAVEDLVKELQSYGSPRMDEDGNIIIPRRDDPGADETDI